MQISGYTGDAGDAMELHNGMMFSASDHERHGAGENCAASYKGKSSACLT